MIFIISPSKKGFTLIELLVVVAIISILASVVITFLNSSRKESEDVAVKSNLQTVAKEAGIYYLAADNSYGQAFNDYCPIEVDLSSTSMFAKDQTVIDAVSEAMRRGSGNSYCYNTGSSWAVAIELKSDTTSSICVDSESNSISTNKTPDQSIVNGICSNISSPNPNPLPKCFPRLGHPCKKGGVKFEPL